MPIISKETWDKFTQEEKDKIRQAMKEIPNETASVETLLIELFPKEAFQPKPLTYEDVARELFFEKKGFYIASDSRIDEMIFDQQYKVWLQTNNCTSHNQAEKILAINRLLNVAKFLNGDWKPDWENIHEYKWYLRLDSGSKIDTDCCSTDNKCVVYFRTEELAKQVVAILGESTVRLALSSDF